MRNRVQLSAAWMRLHRKAKIVMVAVLGIVGLFATTSHDLESRNSAISGAFVWGFTTARLPPPSTVFVVQKQQQRHQLQLEHLGLSFSIPAKRPYNTVLRQIDRDWIEGTGSSRRPQQFQQQRHQQYPNKQPYSHANNSINNNNINNSGRGQSSASSSTSMVQGIDPDAWQTELTKAELLALLDTAQTAARAAGEVIMAAVSGPLYLHNAENQQAETTELVNADSNNMRLGAQSATADSSDSSTDLNDSSPPSTTAGTTLEVMDVVPTAKMDSSSSSNDVAETSGGMDATAAALAAAIPAASRASTAISEADTTPQNVPNSDMLAPTNAVSTRTVREASLTHQKSSIKDIATLFDIQAQDAVEAVIRSIYPNHAFLGEEEVASGASASDAALRRALQQASISGSHFVWICDPIDGTANFASGLALSAVTLAVVYKGTIVVGVVYDPYRGDMFSAVKGEGAYINDVHRLHVTQDVTVVRDAVINAGCPVDPKAFACSVRGVMALNAQTRGIRMIACSALTTAWIAAGRLTAHFGYDLNSWDLAAGALLIQEAGGMVTDLRGTPYNLATRDMLCSNGFVHEQVLDILRDADAITYNRRY